MSMNEIVYGVVLSASLYSCHINCGWQKTSLTAQQVIYGGLGHIFYIVCGFSG